MANQTCPRAHRPCARLLGLLLSFLVGLLVLAPATAAAQPAPARQAPAGQAPEKKSAADQLKAQGDEAMDNLKYEDALGFYNRAYDVDPRPALLYNRGRALEALTRFPEALDELEKFRAVAPDALKAKVPKLGELIEEIRGKISTLRVESNVDGAHIFVRKREVGRTPLRKPLRLNAGKAEIEIRLEGYKPFQKTLVLEGGGGHTLNAQLELKSNIGVLVVASTVAGARVKVNGKNAGTVPVEVPLAAGKHQITITAEGYKDAKTSAVVVAGARKQVRVPLEKKKPITQRWWFWTGLGAAVVTGGVLGWVFRPTAAADDGDIPPGQVGAPLLRF